MCRAYKLLGFTEKCMVFKTNGTFNNSAYGNSGGTATSQFSASYVNIIKSGRNMIASSRFLRVRGQFALTDPCPRIRSNATILLSLLTSLGQQHADLCFFMSISSSSSSRDIVYARVEKLTARWITIHYNIKIEIHLWEIAVFVWVHL